MNGIKMISGVLAVAMVLSGCATMSNAPDGAGGPKLTHSYEIGADEQYVQVGMEFTSMGDFVAIVNPKRWKNPLAPGGSISWINPGAWRHDWGRTGRIFLGEAVLVGIGVAAAASGGGDDDDGGSSGPTDPGDAPPPPPPPPIVP